MCTAMFHSNTQFNQNIRSWDVSSINNMAETFFGASAFSQNLCLWGTKVGSPVVTNMFAGSGGVTTKEGK